MAIYLCMTIPSGLKSLMQDNNAVLTSLLLPMSKCFSTANAIIILTNNSSERTLSGSPLLTNDD